MGDVSNVDPLPSDLQVYDISNTDVSSGSTLDTSAASGISTLEELQKQAPAVYKAMVESLFWDFHGQQEASNQRIKEALQEGSGQGA